MASVNKVIIVGNLGRDPEIRYTAGGDAICNVSVATTDSWKDKNGEKQEKTEWHRISMFKKLAEIAGEYLKKGSQAYFEGRLQTRKWTDKEGQERYTTEVVADRMQMLSGKKEEDEPKKARSDLPREGGFDDMDDDIPFNRVEQDNHEKTCASKANNSHPLDETMFDDLGCQMDG